MKFFLPDSQDMVDPSFDFVTETRSEFRIRQHDDRYAHELFGRAPFDGLLVSMGIVFGIGAGRYTMPHRHRLLRVGAREFFRLPAGSSESRIDMMGDCGAFSYVREPEPPYATAEVVDFYVDCGFDYGISPDHVVLGFKPELDGCRAELDSVPPDWMRRQAITLSRAREFLEICSARRVGFEPIGVAHGWSPVSYTEAFEELQQEGYKLIALGGLVPLDTPDILSILQAVAKVRQPLTQIHLLGVSRIEHVPEFSSLGVTSFDSTSPLRQAFKSERHNYHTADRTYSAVRIPQVDANPKLTRRIRAGDVDQAQAKRLERRCLEVMAAFDQDQASVQEVLEPLTAYELLCDGNNTRTARYREVLQDRPWRQCPCEVCRDLGHHVILFRGAERNRRRGFHNIFVLHERLKNTRKEMA